MGTSFKSYRYRVAGLPFSVSLPGTLDAASLLPSFSPFAVKEPSGGGRDIFCLDVLPGPVSRREGAVLLERTDNDMGHLSLYRQPGGYCVEIRQKDSGPVHVLSASGDFSSAEACVDWTDPSGGTVLNSMLRIMFSQSALLHHAVSIHASAVCLDGRAYLFTGPSGTGKSTHSALWIKCFPGCMLLNDDNPVLKVSGDTVTACGSPWSGKTPCYRDMEVPVGGIVRLYQAGKNRFIPKNDVEAFSCLLPGCSVIRHDSRLLDALCDTLSAVASGVGTGILECRPDMEAAILCRESFCV